MPCQPISEEQLNKMSFWSPLSEESARKAFSAGEIGTGHEVCYEGQHKNCLQFGKCFGSDKFAVGICRPFVFPDTILSTLKKPQNEAPKAPQGTTGNPFIIPL